MNICTTVLQPAILPTSVSIQAVTIALLRLDPSGSVLTPAHVALVEAAYQTGDYGQPEFLDLIGRKILFYPNMYNQTPKGTIPADMSLPPSVYMGPAAGNLVPPLKPADVLGYDLVCGMIYTARREWHNAYDSFLRCATHPSKDGGVSQIMVHAFKRLSLVSLLINGRLVQLPSYTSTSAAKVAEIIGKPYIILASLFEGTNAKELMKHVSECEKIWDQDQNTSLVSECLVAYQKWKIIELRDVFTKMLISDVRTQTQSALTGEPCATDAETEELVRDMISGGMLRGRIGTTDDGRKYLEFLAKSPVLSEKEYHEALLASAEKLKEVEPLWRLTDERISTSKEHVKSLVRMEKSNRRGGGGYSTFMDPGFDDTMEDEDLMEEAF